MLSHISRRRWWKLLKSLDSGIELSKPMRESLVIKACTSDSRSFEVVSATLVEHYSIMMTAGYKDAYVDAIALLSDHNIRVPARYTEKVSKNRVDRVSSSTSKRRPPPPACLPTA